MHNSDPGRTGAESAAETDPERGNSRDYFLQPPAETENLRGRIRGVSFTFFSDPISKMEASRRLNCRVSEGFALHRDAHVQCEELGKRPAD